MTNQTFARLTQTNPRLLAVYVDPEDPCATIIVQPYHKFPQGRDARPTHSFTACRTCMLSAQLLFIPSLHQRHSTAEAVQAHAVASTSQLFILNQGEGGSTNSESTRRQTR